MWEASEQAVQQGFDKLQYLYPVVMAQTAAAAAAADHALALPHAVAAAAAAAVVMPVAEADVLSGAAARV